MKKRVYEVPSFYFDEFQNIYEWFGYTKCIATEEKNKIEGFGGVEIKVIEIDSEDCPLGDFAYIPKALLERYSLPEYL